MASSKPPPSSPNGSAPCSTPPPAPRRKLTASKTPAPPGQRQHDGLLDALKLLARAELLPDVAGITTNVLLMMTPEAFATGEGTATTGHGVVLPVREVMMWVDGATVVIPIVLNEDRAIVNIGTGQRLFSKRQRIGLIARDRGCCFPGCTAPPQWTEAHHVIEYAEGGPTATDSGGPPANEGVAGGGGCLLCGFHHREFEKLGWLVRMNDGVPEWLPPAWIDPDRKPVTNRSHDPAR
jgi:hypothetical protein